MICTKCGVENIFGAVKCSACSEELEYLLGGVLQDDVRNFKARYAELTKSPYATQTELSQMRRLAGDAWISPIGSFDGLCPIVKVPTGKSRIRLEKRHAGGILAAKRTLYIPDKSNNALCITELNKLGFMYAPSDFIINLGGEPTFGSIIFGDYCLIPVEFGRPIFAIRIAVICRRSQRLVGFLETENSPLEFGTNGGLRKLVIDVDDGLLFTVSESEINGFAYTGAVQPFSFRQSLSTRIDGYRIDDVIYHDHKLMVQLYSRDRSSERNRAIYEYSIQSKDSQFLLSKNRSVVRERTILKIFYYDNRLHWLTLGEPNNLGLYLCYFKPSDETTPTYSDVRLSTTQIAKNCRINAVDFVYADCDGIVICGHLSNNPGYVVYKLSYDREKYVSSSRQDIAYLPDIFCVFGDNIYASVMATDRIVIKTDGLNIYVWERNRRNG